MATALRKATIDAGADTTLLDTTKGCAAFRVDVPSTSSYGVLVHVDGLHETDEYFVIPPGSSATFRLLDRSIKSVVAQGDGGTATDVTYGQVAKTP